MPHLWNDMHKELLENIGKPHPSPERRLKKENASLGPESTNSLNSFEVFPNTQNTFSSP